VECIFISAISFVSIDLVLTMEGKKRGKKKVEKRKKKV
jgi:hypothetical protein